MPTRLLLEGLAGQLGITLDALLDPQGCHLGFDEAPDLELHWRPREEVLCMSAMVGHVVAHTGHELHLAALLLNPILVAERGMGLALQANAGRIFLRRAVALGDHDSDSLTAYTAQLLEACTQLRQGWSEQGLVAA